MSSIFLQGAYLNTDLAAYSTLVILAIMDSYLDGDWLEFGDGDTIKLTFNKEMTITFPVLI